MKTNKWIALLLSAIMLLSLSVPAFAAEDVEEPETASEQAELAQYAAEIAIDYRPEKTEEESITVGSVTPVSGSFFTTQFGNNMSDIDVRAMIHGYSPVVWADQIDFMADPQVVYELVTEVDEETNNVVYTVYLQEDLTYNDGTPITAKDYVFSYLMALSPEFAALGANTGSWEHVLGYEAYASGETDALEGLALIDDYTFSLTVKSDYEPYFYELGYLYIFPYPASVIAPGCDVVMTDSGAMIADADAEEPTQTVYTAELLTETVLGENGYLSHPMLTAGPYKLVSYDAETGTVEFALNEYYKGNAEGVSGWYDKVTLVHIEQDDVIDALDDGDVQIMNKLVSGDVLMDAQDELDDEDFEFETYARQGYGFLAFACEKGPQASEKVRQAIAYAFDTEEFVSDFLGMFGTEVYGYYGMGQWMTQAAEGELRPDDMTEDEEPLWDDLTLDSLNTYALDLEKAEALLIEDGWTLNENGEDYDPENDTVRYKMVDGELTRLTFDFALCRNNKAATYAAAELLQNLTDIGAEVIIRNVSYTELLQEYYRQSETRYDICFMATNFLSTFDPYDVFSAGEEFNGAMNTSGLVDEELIDLAWELRKTEPWDLLEFMAKWLDFQERFNEILPTMPIYSNNYVDILAEDVQNYFPNQRNNWAEALLYAYTGDPVDASEFEEAE